MNTRAAVLVAIDEPLRLIDLEIPDLAEGQVLVDIAYAGVCRTQINEWKGAKGPDRYLPHTLGHEGSGVVTGVGPGVTTVGVGDAVILTWMKTPGLEGGATSYRSEEGEINSGPISTFMTRAVISENRALPCGDVPLDVAALLGCAVPTGCGMVVNQLQPELGASIAIIGVGGIGLCAIAAARVSGCDPIIAIDIEPGKLDFALKMGATHAVDGGGNPNEQVREIVGATGVDYCVECVGSTRTMETGFDLVRKGGGHLLIAGNAPKGERISIDPFELIEGKCISGSWGGDSDLARDLSRYRDWYAEGLLPLRDLITHRLPLAEINTGMQITACGQAGRVLIEVEGAV
jgi:S-(hydroxymethyl)glutathione dehydrogenase/alcohol dehydrogenase